MTPEKREKIQALLDNSASSDNEKEICRRLLDENPEKPDTWFEESGEITQKAWDQFKGYWKGASAFITYFSRCEKCGNQYQDENPLSLYCEICLKSLQKEAGKGE